jgi:hypothetical protein
VLLVENEGPRPLFRKKLRCKLAGWQGSPLAGSSGSRRLRFPSPIRNSTAETVEIGIASSPLISAAVIRMRQNLQQPERGDSLGLALQSEGLDHLGPDCIFDEPVRGLAYEHLAWLRRALQPCGDVDRITKGQRRWDSGAISQTARNAQVRWRA